MSQYRIRHDHDLMPTGAGDTVRQRLGMVVVMVGVLIAIALGDRRIRKEREQEEREKREREAAGQSE